MTFDKSWPFQTLVVSTIETAITGVEVFAYPPEPAPDRFIRVDGFTTTPTDDFRNQEVARHGLTIHIVDSPRRGTKSLEWVKEIAGEVVTALTGLKLDVTSQGLRPQGGESRLEPRDDDTMAAHAFVRFTSRIR